MKKQLFLIAVAAGIMAGCQSTNETGQMYSAPATTPATPYPPSPNTMNQPPPPPATPPSNP